MEGINIGDKIAFHITGNHNIGYAKGERYVGTVLSRDHRSRLHVRAKVMSRACIDERDVDKLIEESMDFDMDEVTYAEGDIHIIVHECMEYYVDNVEFGKEFHKNK